MNIPNRLKRGLHYWVKDFNSTRADYGTPFAIKRAARQSYVHGLRVGGLFYNYGTPIWRRNWDVLVVLDACRADAFNRIYGNDPRFDAISSIYSVGSHSSEWFERTFKDEYADQMSQTAYVGGNPFATQLKPQEMAAVERVNIKENNIIQPKPITDVAVKTHKEQNPDRMIVHYMQPHKPYVGNNGEEDMFLKLERGDISREEILSLYDENLEFIVEHVFDTLLNGIDADTVVLTADHGEMFGDSFVYKHPSRLLHPRAKHVPWATTQATDNGYQPDNIEQHQNISREEHLEALGYK